MILIAIYARNFAIFRKKKEKGKRKKNKEKYGMWEENFMAIKLIQLKDLNCRISKERIIFDGFYIRWIWIICKFLWI